MTQPLTIPIYFTFDKYYVLGACVAFDTMLRCASPHCDYHLYVAHTGLKPKHMQRMDRVVARYANAKITYIDVSHYDTGWKDFNFKSHFSQEIFFKLTAAEMFLQYDRILFSDVDVIFQGDISEAYRLCSDDDFYFAGVKNPYFDPWQVPKYVQNFTEAELEVIDRYEVFAGFMLVNLKKLRQDDMQPRLIDTYLQNRHRFYLPEQDCIALCCAPAIRQIDMKFCFPNVFLADKDSPEVVQLHYLYANKPWCSPFCRNYCDWLKACKQAGMIWLYLRLQPLFLYQRLKRKSLRRFIGKAKKRVKRLFQR